MLEEIEGTCLKSYFVPILLLAVMEMTVIMVIMVMTISIIIFFLSRILN